MVSIHRMENTFSSLILISFQVLVHVFLLVPVFFSFSLRRKQNSSFIINLLLNHDIEALFNVENDLLRVLSFLLILST